MIKQEFVVTTAPEMDGMHFVHTTSCQVLPAQETEGLGTFEDCAEAVAIAARRYAPLNACALCCSSCYVKSGEEGAA
mgnify:CR=1 FL=1